ncbi:MAG TPA: LysR family transcriptional regulator [Steroidobacteraceae bacterium]|nr:LysR family transcriptional regulator [Steroidobacteraceae bacterium]
MSTAPRITLDQWAALVAVVEQGGYAQASRRLHRTQSTVTYTIKKLEEQIGLAVFELQGRKAVLTPAGQVLYRRGKALLDDAARIERSAAALAQGWEPELRLAVDTIFPTWLLLRALAQFGEERPEVRIELIETVLGGTEDALLEGRVDFIVGNHVPGGFIGDALMQVRFVCAAAPSHPLHQLGRALTLDDLRAHRHLIVRDSGTRRDRHSGWLNERRWTVSNKATSIRAACMGLGFAWYAEENIRQELDTGALRELPLVEGAERFVTLYLVYADSQAAGPGARRLAAILAEKVAGTAGGKLT